MRLSSLFVVVGILCSSATAAETVDEQIARLIGDGKYAEAEPLARQAVSTSMAAPGLDTPETAIRLENLAIICFRQGNHDEAESRLKQVLAIREKTDGPWTQATADSVINLADFYRAQRKYSAAEPLFRRALKILETTGGINGPHPETVDILRALAAVCRSQGNLLEADELSSRVTALSRSADQERLENEKLVLAAAAAKSSEASRVKVLAPRLHSTEIASPVPSKYEEWRKCTKKFWELNTRSAAETDPAIYDTFYNSLLMIDVNNCPADYQQAWADYLGLEREYVEYSKSNCGFFNFWSKAITVAATGGGILAADIAELRARSDRRTSLEGALKTLAIKYGYKGD